MPDSKQPLCTSFAITCACVFISMAGVTGAQVWQPGTQWVYSPTSQAGALFAAAVASGDFNDDGFTDLVVGQPMLDTADSSGTYANAGAYHMYLGGVGGLRHNASFYNYNAQGNAGWAVATGDFDGDGRDEVAVGIPGYFFWTPSHEQVVSGRVLVLNLLAYSGWDDTVPYRPGDNGVPGLPEDYDNFGRSLAVGDFNDDGYEDLAIGSPGEDVEATVTYNDVGAVTILYGSSSGLVSSGSQLFTAGSSHMDGVVPYQQLGFSMASGDFDHDGYDDLAIGSPFRDMESSSTTYPSAGEVYVLFGGSSGLSTSGNQRLSAASFGEPLEPYQDFGYALAAADFDRNGGCESIDWCADDLAIGLPGASSDRGEVLVSYGAIVAGLSRTSFQTITQADLSGSNPETDDRLGESLAAGEQDARPGAELVIGVPEEDWTSATNQGMAHLVFGGAGELGSYPDEWVAEVPTFGTPGEAGDFFAWSIALGDFNGDGTGDLALGVEGGWVEGQDNAGHLKVLYGALFADGFELAGTSQWSKTVAP